MPANYHHVALVFGQTGQVVEYYPGQSEILLDGAPTAAATYAVYDGTQSNDASALFSGSATLDSVSTTFDAASGYGQTNRYKANLTATTNIAVGRRYLAANATGQREIIIPRLIASADYVESEEPLAFDYAAADTFKGLRHYFTIDATFIADADNINTYGSNPALDQPADTTTSAPPYRVKWTYTAGSTQRIAWTFFDVARAPMRPLVSFDELRQIAPDIIHHEWIGTRGQDFAGQLIAAERELRIKIRTAGYDPDQIHDAEIHQELLRRMWLITIGKGLLMSKPEIGAWLESAMSDFDLMFDKTINSTLRAWVSTSSTGAITSEPARQLWLRGR